MTLSADGTTLYGTAQGGAYYDGTIFSLPISGGSFTVLATFDGSNGEYPTGGLTLGGNTLYGTTYGDNGGAYDLGTVSALQLAPTPEPSTFALLAAGAAGIIGYGLPVRGLRHVSRDFPDLGLVAAGSSGRRGALLADRGAERQAQGAGRGGQPRRPGQKTA